MTQENEISKRFYLPPKHIAIIRVHTDRPKLIQPSPGTHSAKMIFYRTTHIEIWESERIAT